MNILDFLLIILTVILLYKFYGIYKKNNSDNIKNISDKQNINVNDKSLKYIDMILKSKTKIKYNLNPYFTETQFHNDYRDTLNAINILIPNQKQLFNKADLPLINVNTPSTNEIKPLIKTFINEINKIIDKTNSEGIVTQDWKNNYGEKDYESGWDKQQRKLGLPGSIYTKPAKKAHIKLINVDRLEKFETENEIRYTIFIIVQKENVKDQMLVKVNFQIDKQDINLDREFFDKEKNSYETLVKIEEIFVMGFLTKQSFGKQSVKNDYYNFDNITDGKMFSSEQIIKELNNKRKQYELEYI